MRFKWRHGWVVLLLVATAAGVFAQRVFPVQGTLVLTPPYSPYLSDLTAAGSQRLFLQVRVTDPTVAEYTCRFRIRIDGAGISLFTRPEFIGPPVVLPGGGVVQLLYGDELADYFRPANLIFQGITQRDYERTNRLPEGVYRFTLEVLDYNRGTAVSNAATATAWMVLNDPPLLNLPRQLVRLPQQEPTNIPFLWTPRHTASVNAAFTTEYYFKLVELPPSVTDASFPSSLERGGGEVWINAANQAMLAQPPIYEITTTQSALVYGPGEPALIPGRLYAWQVQARDTESRDLFKNLGRSEVFVFQYGEALGMPENVQSSRQTPTGMTLGWEPPQQGDMPERYRISYKPDYADRWYEITTTNRWFNVGDLRPDASVQVKLRAEKGSQTSAYTPVLVVRTAPESSAFQCGAPAPPPAAVPANPSERLFKLLPGDRLTINRFTILVATAEGSNGQFTGTGWMKIPAFNGVGVRVRFRGSVNTNYMLDGEAVTIASGGNWASSLIEEMEKIGEERRKIEEAGRPTAVEITITVAGVIDSVYVNPAGDIVVLKADGSEQTVPRPTASANAATAPGGVPPVVLQDEAGNRYRVEKDEKTGETKVTNMGNTTATAVAADVNYRVQFGADPAQKFGFDAPGIAALQQHYRTERVGDADYPIAWKSVAVGSIDQVQAGATAARAAFAQEIAFASPFGPLAKMPGAANQVRVMVQGRTHEDIEEVRAYLTKDDANGKKTEHTVGRLNVIAYDQEIRNLVLVPVNNTPLPMAANTLKQELDRIYAPAVVQWQVQTQEGFSATYDTDNNGLEYGTSGLLSNYTGEMRTILRAYTQTRPLAPNTYYLFIVPKADAAGLTGYMPRKKQAGFLFADALGKMTPAQIAKVVGHELGHGAFHLRHVFPPLPQTGTNLMDYSAAGITLHKHQWDDIHNPEAVMGLFENDEEAASKYDCPMWFSGECESVGKILELIKDLSTKGGKVTTRSPINTDRKELIAEYIKLNGTSFQKITIINLVEKDKEYTYDPRNYEKYSQSYLNREGKSDHQRGFVYRIKAEGTDQGEFLATPGVIIVKILLYEEEDVFVERLGQLEKYLFGRDVGATEELTSNEKRFVVFKDDANIRNKVAPYALVMPEALLEKGREVELITQLVEGEGARSLVRYKGESEEYCTSTGNLKEIVALVDDQQYKLKSDLSPLVLPYSENVNGKISTSEVVYVTHECGVYKCVSKKNGDKLEELGWVKSEYLKKYIDNSKLSKDEFNRKLMAATAQAVSDVTEDWSTTEAACNLCVRAALRNLTGDDVLFPTIGSSITIRDNGDQIKGKVVAGEGNAQGIVDDLMNGKLSDYFEEIEKTGAETYVQFWTRLQQMVDNNKAIIIGTHDPGHVFMIVPGGLHEVIDNSERENSKENISDTNVALGDRWGGSYARRGQEYVLRIMDCGMGVKFSNGPLYGVMDAGATMGEKTDRIVKYFKYKVK